MWKPKTENPSNPNWYATWRAEYPRRVVPRYFDDTEPDGLNWYILRSGPAMECDYEFLPSNDEPLPCLVVNMSFDMWHPLPEPPKSLTTHKAETATPQQNRGAKSEVKRVSGVGVQSPPLP